MKKPATGIALAFACLPAMADSGIGFYSGVGVGQVTLKDSIDGVGIKATRTGFKVFGGYRDAAGCGLNHVHQITGKVSISCKYALTNESSPRLRARLVQAKRLCSRHSVGVGCRNEPAREAVFGMGVSAVLCTACISLAIGPSVLARAHCRRSAWRDVCDSSSPVHAGRLLGNSCSRAGTPVCAPETRSAALAVHPASNVSWPCFYMDHHDGSIHWA